MGKKENSYDDNEDRFESLFLALLAFSITLLIAVQCVIINNGNTIFSHAAQEDYGKILKKTEYLYNYGFITLQLRKDEPEPELYILKNGTRVGDFSSLIVQLEVISGDIIEIDATNVSKEVSVRVVKADKIFSPECENVSISLFNEVKQLLKVK